mmetsp:Transcript_29550/g.96569  ORF Transcript_29550/g.96569 Transcript_29550/m.96569 type:complete len:235 (-) Transcript_29550:177-881(-)
MPRSGPSAAALTTALISSYVAGLARRTVRSTTDTSGVGTRNAMPVSLPFSSGITLPTALAAPVDAGMMFCPAQRPARQSLPPREGPSTVSWLAVMACTVVIRPSSMPNVSLMILARGARQLVVQLALEMTRCSGLNVSSFTPITYMGVSSLGGAEMMTRLAPPSKWPLAFSDVVKTPVDSQTASTSRDPHGISAGTLLANTAISLPSMTSLPSLASTEPSNRPCTESYLNWYAM